MNDVVQEARELLDLVLLRSEWRQNEKAFAECMPELALEGWIAALAPLLEDEMLKRVVSDNYALRKLLLEYHIEQGRWLDVLEGGFSRRLKSDDSAE